MRCGVLRGIWRSEIRGMRPQSSVLICGLWVSWRIPTCGAAPRTVETTGQALRLVLGSCVVQLQIWDHGYFLCVTVVSTSPARRHYDLAPIWRGSQGATQNGNPPSHSTCASSPRAAGVNSALSADSRSSRSSTWYWASNRADCVSRRSAGVMLAFLAQIPASRNLDNPCTLRAEIGDARRLQHAAVECRGYRAVVEAVSHEVRPREAQRCSDRRE